MFLDAILGKYFLVNHHITGILQVLKSKRPQGLDQGKGVFESSQAAAFTARCFTDGGQMMVVYTGWNRFPTAVKPK